MPGFEVLALILFAWLSGKNGSSWIFALVFTALVFVAAALGDEFYAFNATVNAVITFVYCSVYFWLMHRFGTNTVVFFIILLGGVAVWVGWPQIWQAMS